MRYEKARYIQSEFPIIFRMKPNRHLFPMVYDATRSNPPATKSIITHPLPPVSPSTPRGRAVLQVPRIPWIIQNLWVPYPSSRPLCCQSPGLRRSASDLQVGNTYKVLLRVGQTAMNDTVSVEPVLKNRDGRSTQQNLSFRVSCFCLPRYGIRQVLDTITHIAFFNMPTPMAFFQTTTKGANVVTEIVTEFYCYGASFRLFNAHFNAFQLPLNTSSAKPQSIVSSGVRITSVLPPIFSRSIRSISRRFHPPNFLLSSI